MRIRTGIAACTLNHLVRASINYHCYSGDTQLYMTLKSGDNFDGTSSSTETWVADTGSWLNSNMPKLNRTKTEFTVLSSKPNVKNSKNIHATLGSS